MPQVRVADAPQGVTRVATSAIWVPLTVLAMAVYLPALHGPFTFDDRTEILENWSIRNPADFDALVWFNLTRPLVNLSYALDYAIWGLNPLGYHLTNMALHAANVALAWAVSSALLRDAQPRASSADPVVIPLLASVTATLFALHPLATEAVAYISSRSEVLAAALTLAAFLLFRSFLVTGRLGWLISAAGLFIASAATRETAAMLPFALLAYHVMVLRMRGVPTGWRHWSFHGVFLGLVLAAGAWRVWLLQTIEQPDGAGLSLARLLVVLMATAKYIALFVVPFGQTVVHPMTPPTFVQELQILTAAAAVAVLVAAGWLTLRKAPAAAFGVVWFFLYLLPSSALVLAVDRVQPIAEHRAYLANFGLALAVAAGVGRFLLQQSDARRAAIRVGIAATVAAGVLAVLTVSRNVLWGDPVLLWEDAARKAPQTYAAQYGLADAYQAVSDCESAVPAYIRAVALRPGNADAYLGLAGCQRELADGAAVRRTLKAGLDRIPADRRLTLALAAMEEARQNRAEALRLCSALQQQLPEDADLRACVQRNSR